MFAFERVRPPAPQASTYGGTTRHLSKVRVPRRTALVAQAFMEAGPWRLAAVVFSGTS